METVGTTFKAMGVMGYVIPAVAVVYTIGLLLWMRKAKNALQKWLKEHPEAVHVSFKTGLNPITSKTMTGRVLSENAYPQIVYEGGKTGIYALPGTAEVELSYTYTRPGILHKSVSTTWGPAKLSLNLEAGKSYTLSFDQKEENFKLTADN